MTEREAPHDYFRGHASSIDERITIAILFAQFYYAAAILHFISRRQNARRTLA